MAKVLIIGSGGREHALGWKLAQSPHVDEVLYLPGNAGTAEEEKARNLPHFKYDPEYFPAIDRLMQDDDVAFAVVGPEKPLEDGIADYLTGRGRNVFGPSAAAAKLEADKFFSHALMAELGIPQATSVECYSAEQATAVIRGWTHSDGVVLKARGLWAGKGVTVFENTETALAGLDEHVRKFGSEFLVAERLHGEEYSVLSIADGTSVMPVPISFQDHKRLLDGDQGPNTGGMGAYGPAPVATREVVQEIAERVMTPVVREMVRRGMPYTGFLYVGVMMTDTGPRVLEFNVRMGDPECQPAMMLLRSDLYELLHSAVLGKAGPVEMREGASCCVVLASPGYPGKVEKGKLISGLEEAAQMPGVKVFHAGTKFNEDDKIVTDSGRVLGITTYLANGIAAAQRLAYQAANKITIPGGFHYRTDIADRAIRGKL